MKKYSFGKRQIERKVERTVKNIDKLQWKYRNIIFLISSIIVAYILLKIPSVYSLISNLEYFGYFGAFIGGIFFSYGLTTAPASAVLFILGTKLNPFFIALIGASGSVLSDYFIFKFVKNRLMDEIKILSVEIDNNSKPFFNLLTSEKNRTDIWKKFSRSKIWKKIVPIIAGFIIASPLPDELGVALFGATNYEPKKLVLYCYLLNFLGILGISSLAIL